MKVARIAISSPIGPLGILVCALGPAPAGDARAAGFFLTDRGASALARGGAAVVASDDLNAAWFNPSLVGRGDPRGWLTYVDLGFIQQDVRFERSLDERTAATYPGCCAPVENEAPPYPVPSIMVGWAPAGEPYALALSAYGPYGGMPRYPAAGAQRYSLVSVESALLAFQATLAYALSDDVRVGVGFQARDFTLRQRLTISSFPGFLGGPEDAAWDSLVEVDVADRRNPGAVVGAWWRPLPGWEVGASWQTPLAVDAEGDLRVEVAGHYMFRTAYVEGSRIRLKTELPQIARVGLRRVGSNDAYDAELDVVWEGWGVHDYVTVTPREQIRFRSVAGVGDYAVRRFRVDEGFQDTLSVRLGGAWRADVLGLPELRLRTGGFWESSAVPSETLTVNLVDADKVGLGLGAGLDVGGGVRMDVGYAHVFLASRDVVNSRRRQTNTLYAEDNQLRTEGRTIVGNGRYKSSYNAVALTVGAAF